MLNDIMKREKPVVRKRWKSVTEVMLRVTRDCREALDDDADDDADDNVDDDVDDDAEEEENNVGSLSWLLYHFWASYCHLIVGALMIDIC